MNTSTGSLDYRYVVVVVRDECIVIPGSIRLPGTMVPYRYHVGLHEKTTRHAKVAACFFWLSHTRYIGLVRATFIEEYGV